MHFPLDPWEDGVCASPSSQLEYHYRTAHQLLEAKKTIDRRGLSQSFTAKANINSPVATPPESAQRPPHYPVAFLKPQE